jgi:hypothetical protein
MLPGYPLMTDSFLINITSPFPKKHMNNPADKDGSLDNKKETSPRPGENKI